MNSNKISCQKYAFEQNEYNSSPILELSVKFASQICHKNNNKPLDVAYLADFGIDIMSVVECQWIFRPPWGRCWIRGFVNFSVLYSQFFDYHLLTSDANLARRKNLCYLAFFRLISVSNTAISFYTFAA